MQSTVSGITNQFNNMSSKISSGLDTALENPWLMALIKVFLILYASKLAPSSKVLDTFLSNTYVKLILIVIMIYLENKDIQMSILLAFILMFGITAFGNPSIENFEDFATFKKSDLPIPLEPHTMLVPGCENITMEDIVAAFDNDKLALQTNIEKSFAEILAQLKSKTAKEKVIAMAYQVGLPYNVNWDDPLTAPLVATLLVNYGVIINNKCKLP